MATKRRTSSQKDKDYQPDMSSDSAESDHDSTNEELEQEGQGMDPLEVEELVALTEKPTAKELGAANILIQQYKNSLLDDFPNSQKSLKQVFSLRNAMEKSKLKNETEEEALTRKAVEIIKPKKRRRNQSPSSSQSKKQKESTSIDISEESVSILQLTPPSPSPSTSTSKTGDIKKGSFTIDNPSEDYIQGLVNSKGFKIVNGEEVSRQFLNSKSPEEKQLIDSFAIAQNISLTVVNKSWATDKEGKKVIVPFLSFEKRYINKNTEKHTIYTFDVPFSRIQQTIDGIQWAKNQIEKKK